MIPKLLYVADIYIQVILVSYSLDPLVKSVSCGTFLWGIALRPCVTCRYVWIFIYEYSMSQWAIWSLCMPGHLGKCLVLFTSTENFLGMNTGELAEKTLHLFLYVHTTDVLSMYLYQCARFLVTELIACWKNSCRRWLLQEQGAIPWLHHLVDRRTSHCKAKYVVRAD